MSFTPHITTRTDVSDACFEIEELTQSIVKYQLNGTYIGDDPSAKRNFSFKTKQLSNICHFLSDYVIEIFGIMT